MNDAGQSAIAAGDEVVSVSDVKALEKKVKQREQMLGRKTMEAEILRDALEIAQSKKLISHMPLLPPDDIRSVRVGWCSVWTAAIAKPSVGVPPPGVSAAK
ncbi:hypothetical protein HW114_14135 [Serratia symbiotica]|uniref:hypothetical protein n=1 Tax=Serratia symbiotica TaxID=138074 RepID=UPI001889347A|nr:hypothetical protein [Serratia symbiotica]MBF1996520.1 hypothetical protein [Serratia symbiotica]